MRAATHVEGPKSSPLSPGQPTDSAKKICPSSVDLLYLDRRAIRLETRITPFEISKVKQNENFATPRRDFGKSRRNVRKDAIRAAATAAGRPRLGQPDVSHDFRFHDPKPAKCGCEPRLFALKRAMRPAWANAKVAFVMRWPRSCQDGRSRGSYLSEANEPPALPDACRETTKLKAEIVATLARTAWRRL